MIDALITQYAKEGVFLALFLYLLFQTLSTNKETRTQLKEDIQRLEEKHDQRIDDLHVRYQKEMQEIKDDSKKREEKLLHTLEMAITKYDDLDQKLDEFITEIRRGIFNGKNN
jgi:hypothetical protein